MKLSMRICTSKLLKRLGARDMTCDVLLQFDVSFKASCIGPAEAAWGLLYDLRGDLDFEVRHFLQIKCNKTFGNGLEPEKWLASCFSILKFGNSCPLSVLRPSETAWSWIYDLFISFG